MKTIIEEKYENEVENLSERLKSDGVRYFISLNDGISLLGFVNTSPREIISMVLDVLEKELKPEAIITLFKVAITAVAMKHTMESED